MGNLFSEIKMKRTAQRFDKPGQNIPEHTSGCRQFEGEDLMYNERIKRNAQNQRDWADQQIREKNQKNCQEKEDDRMYAMQTEAITRMRGMLEDEASQKKNQNAKTRLRLPLLTIMRRWTQMEKSPEKTSSE